MISQNMKLGGREAPGSNWVASQMAFQMIYEPKPFHLSGSGPVNRLD